MKFIPTNVGTIKFPKQYKKNLLNSKDNDFIEFAKLDGTKVKFMEFIQIAQNKDSTNVFISNPIEMTVPRKLFINIESIITKE